MLVSEVLSHYLEGWNFIPGPVAQPLVKVEGDKTSTRGQKFPSGVQGCNPDKGSGDSLPAFIIKSHVILDDFNHAMPC